MILTDKIHLLRLDFEIPLSPEMKLARFVNVVIVSGDRIALIDTGTNGGEATIVDRAFRSRFVRVSCRSDVGTTMFQSNSTGF